VDSRDDGRDAGAVGRAWGRLASGSADDISS
jgi:hypothetical protein